MKLVFASDSFKGSLTSEKTSELLTKAANEIKAVRSWYRIVFYDGGFSDGAFDGY